MGLYLNSQSWNAQHIFTLLLQIKKGQLLSSQHLAEPPTVLPNTFSLWGTHTLPAFFSFCLEDKSCSRTKKLVKPRWQRAALNKTPPCPAQPCHPTVTRLLWTVFKHVFPKGRLDSTWSNTDECSAAVQHFVCCSLTAVLLTAWVSRRSRGN